MVDEIGAVDPVYLTTVEKQSAMVDLARERSRLEAIELRILACSDDVAEVSGARSAAVWVADQTRQAHGVVRRDAVLAEALGSRWGRVTEALGAGAVNVAQARVLVEALDALPADLGDDLRTKAEGYLVVQAEQVRAVRAAPGWAAGSRSISPPKSPTRPTTSGCSPRNGAHGPRGGCRSRLGVTAPPTCTPGSRTTSRSGSAPTSRPLPRRGVRGSATSTPSRSLGVGVRRSARCWRTCPTPGCRCMAVRRRR